MSEDRDYSTSSDSGVLDDQMMPAPSWIRLFDTPSSVARDFSSASRDSRPEDPPDDTSIADTHDSHPWYMSPFFNKPVIGYYNRITQSNLSLAPPFGQSTTDFPGSGTQWTKALNVSSYPTGSHSAGDIGVYSEPDSPWPLAWPNKGQHPGKSAGFLQNGAANLHNHYHNQSYLPSMDGSAEDLSRDQPEVHKPEEYLSGLQTETYSIQYTQRACSTCTRVMAVMLVVMALASVALAVALTVSVLTKKESQSGHSVVWALMTLKILNKNFTEDMANVSSPSFYEVASPYSAELDTLFRNSPLASVYYGNEVVSLGPGSIKTSTKLLFLNTGLVKDEQSVRNVISSAERASQWKQTDAREMGQFIVCADCVTVKLNFTRVRELPTTRFLRQDSTTRVPAIVTSSQTPGQEAGGSVNSTSTEPRILVSNSKPFLSDGHFIFTCDITNATSWTIVTVEFSPDKSSLSDPVVVLVSLRRESPTVAEVADHVKDRARAFPNTSSPDSVSLVVNVTSMTCADRGDYWCRVTLENGRDHAKRGRVEILELPSVPVIRETWTSKAWDATLVYSCSARLGYPPGDLSLSVKDDGNVDSRPISSHSTEAASCEAETEVHVSAMDLGLLGNASRLMCQVFSEHLQMIDSTKYSVYHLTALPRKLEIQTKSAFVDDGLAALRCRMLHPPSWTRLRLLKVTSQGQEEVTSLLNDGSILWTDNYLRSRTLVTTNLTSTLAEFSVFIFSSKCSDRGLYACAVDRVRADVNMSIPYASLNIASKPTRPELMVPVHILENNVDPFPITCKAMVGHPAGNLVLSVRHQGEADFREVVFNEQKMVPLSCTTEVTGIFYPSPDAVKNGTSVSCQMILHESLRDVAETTPSVDVFYVLSNDLCSGLQETNISHPTDCRHVIQCKNDVIVHVHQCPDGFCFEAATGSCSDDLSRRPQKEAPDSVCYPSENQVAYPHPQKCTTYIQCYRGRQVMQHCPTGQLYVRDRTCSADVTQSHCYKTLNTGVWLETNSTVIP